MKKIKDENARTGREHYSRLIGYNFGTDIHGDERIYNGGYWDEETGAKQYEFLLYKNGDYNGNMIVDYKDFRAIIDTYDWPRK